MGGAAVPVWLVAGMALLASAPGYLVWWRNHRAEAHQARRVDRDQAIAGFELLIEELRRELDRRTQGFEADLRRAEADCRRRVEATRRELRTLERAHNALDEEAGNGENQVQPRTISDA